MKHRSLKTDDSDREAHIDGNGFRDAKRTDLKPSGGLRMAPCPFCGSKDICRTPIGPAIYCEGCGVIASFTRVCSGWPVGEDPPAEVYTETWWNRRSDSQEDEEDDKVVSFVHRHLGLEHRRGCMTLFIDGRGFGLTLDEARNIRDSLVEAIAFEECAEELRGKTKDAHDKADAGEILRALAGNSDG